MRSFACFIVGLCLAGGALASPSSAAGTNSLMTPQWAGAEMPVTSVDLRRPQADNSPSLAQDPRSSRRLVLASRVDSPKFDCKLHYSNDGGRLWAPLKPVPVLPNGAEACYAPEVAFDGQGHLYFLFVGLHGRGNSPMGVFLTKSEDSGASFEIPRRILGAQNYQVRMALESGFGTHGRIHLVWLHASQPPPLGGLPPGPNPILASHSDDRGKTFSKPVVVDDGSGRLPVAPSIATTAGGNVVVTYFDLQDDVRDYRGLEGPRWEGNWALIGTVSSNGGTKFGKGTVIDSTISPPQRIMLIFTMPSSALSVDKGRRAFVAWTDARNGDWDVMFSRSATPFRSWTKAKPLGGGAKQGNHQYMPKLAVSQAGRLDAIYYDRVYDPENRKSDVSYTFSNNHGASFSTPKKITDEPSDSTIGPRYAVPSAKGLVEYGGRIGLLSQPRAAVTAWMDTRNVLGRGDELAGPLEQTIFSRVLRLMPRTNKPR